MYNLFYWFFYKLRRIQKKYYDLNQDCPIYIKKIIDYIEWYYNVIVKKTYINFACNKSGINKKNREKKIIISLTSYPKRINTLWLTIETLLRQSMQPDSIILWLAEDQFDGIESLPQELINQQQRGLTIKFCDDLKSHKKYFYVMQEYPEDIIILVDDDTFYSYDLVKKLMKMHKKNPNEIVCMTAALISHVKDVPSKWISQKYNEKLEHSFLAQPFTGQGTLYPPHSLDEEYLFRKDLIMTICPFADDLWLKVMSMKKNTLVTTAYKFRSIPITIYGTSESSLWYINGQDGMNDVQWEKIIHYFSDDFKKWEQEYDKKNN